MPTLQLHVRRLLSEMPPLPMSASAAQREAVVAAAATAAVVLVVLVVAVLVVLVVPAALCAPRHTERLLLWVLAQEVRVHIV